LKSGKLYWCASILSIALAFRYITEADHHLGNEYGYKPVIYLVLEYWERAIESKHVECSVKGSLTSIVSSEYISHRLS
jgi:hypothetical protein